MTEYDGLTRAPILVVDLCGVLVVNVLILILSWLLPYDEECSQAWFLRKDIRKFG